MAVFGKKSDNASEDVSREYVRIPHGTRFGRTNDGKLTISFAGDMSFGEDLPELGELHCGRNLSLDPGVSIKADSVKVKEALELEDGASLVSKEIEAERIVCRKGRLEARTISTGRLETEATRLTADRLSARETVHLDRGDVEIGTVMAQSLTITKGTNANILIAEAAKLEGFVPKGGYDNFVELLIKLFQYHPEILNDRFSAEARRMMGTKTAAAEARPTAPGASPAPAQTPTPTESDALKFPAVAKRLRSLYEGSEAPKEVLELAVLLENNRIEELRRDLTPTYQKLAALGKVPESVAELFREIQRLTRDTRTSA